MRTKLTNATIKDAKKTAIENGKRVEVWDETSAGLFVRISPAGEPTFYLKYRKGSQQRKYKLGSSLTVDEARIEARNAKVLVDKGLDPHAMKVADREAMRMVDLLGDGKDEDHKLGKYTGWYLTTYVRIAGKSVDGKRAAKTAESINTDRVYIKKHLRSRKLLSKQVSAVTTADLGRIKAELTAGAWRKVRNILRVCFKRAEELGVIPTGSNPAAKVTATRSKMIERYLDADERKRLVEAIADAEVTGPRSEGGVAPHIARVFRVLLVTGMRLGEVLDMRWEQIDWRHGHVRLETSKTGAKTVPLTPQAIALLKSEKGTVGRVGRVCGNGNGGARITPSNVQRAWRVVRKAAKLTDVRIHDLRHSWASDAVSAGVPLYVVGAVLGHRSTQTTSRYAHLHDKAILDGLKVAGEAIEKASKG